MLFSWPAKRGKYCSLQHQTLLPSPVTSTTGHCFCFGSISSFFLELFLYSSPVAYGHLPTWGVHLSVPYFLPFHTVHGVFKARILKWLTIPFSIGALLCCSREEIFRIEGKKNPSKTVNTERGHQRADRVKTTITGN